MAASAQGYAAEQSERAGERDRLLDTVAEMSIRGHAEGAVVRAAGWIICGCEHLTQLLLHSEPTMVEDLKAQRRAPLEPLRPAPQERLVATLLS